MSSEAAQLRAWWQLDGGEARRSNTYLRRHILGQQQAAEACFDDYRAGYEAGSRGRHTLPRAIDRYEHEHHGQVIDVRSFRLGFERQRGLTRS